MYYIVNPRCHGNGGWCGETVVKESKNLNALLKMKPVKDFEWDKYTYDMIGCDNCPRICGDRKDPNYSYYIFDLDEYVWRKNSEPKIIIEYSKNGVAINDFETDAFVADVISNIGNGKDYIVSSSVAITALRLAIVEEKMKSDDIKILFYGKCGWEEVKINKYGAIVNCPKNFCDTEIIMCEKILTLAKKKKHKEVDDEFEK